MKSQCEERVEEFSLSIGDRFRIETYVVDSSYLNVFAISDFKRRCVVGVSEGLLIKLNRSQLEAVIAHEVSHLVQGDSLLSSVSSSISLSGYYILDLLDALLKTCISRAKEYRADATAVRMTRNPLALAEALYIISKGWHGDHLPSEALSPIFIVNPRHSKLDEKEGLFANLFATHPPINKRINILLDMAHADLKILESSAKERVSVTEVIPISFPTVQKFWYVSNEGKWDGPFNLVQLSQLTWLTPNTWVKGDGDDKIKPAYIDKELSDIFRGNIPISPDNFSCPLCRQGLESVYYEGVLFFAHLFDLWSKNVSGRVYRNFTALAGD
ncbi:MAG: M48 family metalloprotease [Elusimicrobiota bacterium]